MQRRAVCGCFILMAAQCLSAQAQLSTSGYWQSVTNANPVAYWRLNETNDATVAVDLLGSYNGTISASVTPGVSGPQNPPFLGFETNNTAIQFNYTTGSYLTMPALNLNTNTVTIVGWINPSGIQAGWTGIAFCRGGSTCAGLNFGPGSIPNELRYTWNNSRWDESTGLTVPTSQWSFVALVVTPTNGTIYVGTNGILNSFTDVATEPNQAFDASLLIGYDPSSGSRLFNGRLDEVAIYNHSLTSTQIQQLYTSALTAPAPLALSEVVAWGCNVSGETNVPGGLTNVVAIAAGAGHILALTADGTVVAWGDNSSGQTDVPTGLTNVVAIAAGEVHSLALTADGTVVAWGDNSYGQTSVPTGLTNVMAIAAGALHSLALRVDGTVVGWGYNGYGQTNVPANLENVVAIAAGAFHGLALKADETVVGWGYDGYGQTNAPAELTNIVAIATGDFHNLALKEDGTVVGWGYDGYGQTNAPAQLTNAVAIAGGWYHSLALEADGTVIGWGGNDSGQTNIPAGLSHVTAIGAGLCDSLALVGNGSPVFTAQPSSRIGYVGTTINLTTMVIGSPPFSYQWEFNGVDISEATNSTLALTNLQVADAGVYSVVVSDSFGTVTNRSVHLSVIPLDHFTFFPVSSPQIPGVPFAVTITARDASEGIFPAFTGTVSLSGTSSVGAVFMSPSISGTFTAGQWTGDVTISEPATNMWLVADDGSGHAGVSNPFDVQIGPLHQFGWSVVPSPQGADIPFSVTVTAQDAGGNTVTDFTDSVSFTAWGNGTLNSLEDFESGVWPHSPWMFVNSQATGILSTNCAHDGDYGLKDPYWAYRTDVQLGNLGDQLSWWIQTSTNTGQAAGRAYLGFAASADGCWAFAAAPNTGQILISQHRYGYETTVVFAATNQTWQVNKWYKAVVQFNSSTSVQCNLYDSDGITLLNSLSYTNTSPFVGGIAMESYGGWCLDTIAGGNGSALSMTPPNSGNFSGGTWTGTVSVLEAATNVVLMASGTGRSGTSGQFDVLDPSVLQWLQWQMKYFGCTNCPQAAESADPDGDGFSNLQEFQAGTDPTNSASAFRIIDVWPEDTDMLITWTAVGGKRYILQTTTNFSGNFSNDFVDLNPAIVVLGTDDTEVTVLHMGGATNAPVRFYRVRLVP